MVSREFQKFVQLAHTHAEIIVELASRDTIGYAQLLAILDAHGLPSHETSKFIADLQVARILDNMHNGDYLINTAVNRLVNDFERRGHLTSATFLRNTLVQISTHSTDLRTILIDNPSDGPRIREHVEDLVNMLRDVVTSAHEHYHASMLALGDLKRNQTHYRIDERIAKLEETQRRHITPLRDIVDNEGVFVSTITNLRHTMRVLTRKDELLRDSQSLAQAWQHLEYLLFQVEHELIKKFGNMIRTASDLFTALLAERNVRDAMSYTLAQLPAFFQQQRHITIHGDAHTVRRVGHIDHYALFFAEIVHRRYLPNPQPLHIATVTNEDISATLFTDAQLDALIRQHGTIPSWPQFICHEFGTRRDDTLLNAISYPLLRVHAHVVTTFHAQITCTLPHYTITLTDFAVKWQEKTHA